MILNSSLFARIDKQNRNLQLRKLTRKKGVKYLEELLRLNYSFRSGHHQPQPISLAKLLQSYHSK